MMGTLVYAMLLFFFVSGCAGPAALSEQEKEKLDPFLQQLVEGKPVNEAKLNISVNNDGTKLYGVIISIKPKVKESDLGIHCNTIQPGLATARLTLEEIKGIVKLDAVIRVESGSKSTINN